MRTFIKYIVSVIIISIVSYSLQVLWVKIVEPIMESNGIMFQGILPEGQIISGIAVILINIVGAVVLGVLFNETSQYGYVYFTIYYIQYFF